MMIFGGSCTLFAAFFLPETYEPILLLRKVCNGPPSNPSLFDQMLRTYRHSVYGNKIPQQMLFPISRNWILRYTDSWTGRYIVRGKSWPRNQFLLSSLYTCRSFMAFYMAVSRLTTTFYTLTHCYSIVFEALPVIFIEKRGFSATQEGLVFIGLGIGAVLTTIMNIYYTWKVNKVVPKWKGFPPPELRLYSAMIGSLMLVGSAFWLGWSGYKPSVSWAAPAVSTVFIGMAISAIFLSLIVYIIDTVRKCFPSNLARHSFSYSI